MRQHAHPIRRPNWRRRIGFSVVGAAALVLAGIVVFAPIRFGPAPGGLTAGPNPAAAQEPSPTPPPAAATAAPSPTPSATPVPTPPATSVDPQDATAAATRLKPAHIAMDAWPAPTALPVSQLSGYVWPLAHPRLTLPFGPTAWGTRVVDHKLFHDGVDLATFCGDRIVAVHDGVVLAAGRQFDNFLGWIGDLGPYYHRLDKHHLWPELPLIVVINDGNTYRSVYAHFWKIVVHPGQRVKAGQLIGYEGMSGHATGCHLHYGIFSPLETATFGIKPKVAKDMRLPTLEIARIDPLLVLPYRKGLSGTSKNSGS
ncbi:MAG: M23 family metallopeptidase [Chloroflexota bacterium]